TGAPPTALIAASAFTIPAPTASGEGTVVNLVAVLSRLEMILAGVASGAVWRIRAAIVAACSAACELPQKCQPSLPRKPKKVFEAQSVAAMSGFWITCGAP